MERPPTKPDVAALESATSDPAEFAVRFIWTFNEEAATWQPWPDYPFLRETVFPLIHAPGNRLWEKSQRMMITLSFCAYFLWAWLCTDGFVAKMISWVQQRVDDGGENATWESLFGKMQKMYLRIEPWAVEHWLGRYYPAKKLFGYMKLENLRNGNLITGEAPTSNAGTGSGLTKAFVDEAARVKYLHNIHGNLMQACPNGTHYVSFPNGRANKFAEIRFHQCGASVP